MDKLVTPLSAFGQRLLTNHRSGEIILTAIITMALMCAVLVGQYRCFRVEEQNCQQVQRELAAAISHNLWAAKRCSKTAITSDQR